jgi:hypothetical protein
MSKAFRAYRKSVNGGHSNRGHYFGSNATVKSINRKRKTFLRSRGKKGGWL